MVLNNWITLRDNPFYRNICLHLISLIISTRTTALETWCSAYFATRHPMWGRNKNLSERYMNPIARLQDIRSCLLSWKEIKFVQHIPSFIKPHCSSAGSSMPLDTQ